jgi:hypothetical protein
MDIDSRDETADTLRQDALTIDGWNVDAAEYLLALDNLTEDEALALLEGD